MLQENMRGPIHKITTTDDLWRPRADPGALSRPQGAKGGGQSHYPRYEWIVRKFLHQGDAANDYGASALCRQGEGGATLGEGSPHGGPPKVVCMGAGGLLCKALVKSSWGGGGGGGGCVFLGFCVY